MKKIIYSLVAMLFMGGIITSCIPNTEPQGVTEMRLAHARYLDALASLVKANEAVAAADAAFIQAKAAVKQAAAREKTADAVAKEIANAIAQADADRQIANILDDMEKDRLDNKAALLASQAALAQAQKDLEDALAAIEIEKLAMSTEEATALAAIKANYDKAANDLKAWYNTYLYDIDGLYYQYYTLLQKLIGEATGWGNDDLYEYLYDELGLNIAYKDNQDDWLQERLLIDEYELASKKAEAEFWKGLMNDMEFDYLAEAQAYEDEAEAMAPLFADVLRDSVLFENEYGTARDRAINAANDAYDEAIGAPKEAYDKAVKAIKDANKKWKDQVNELADADIDNPAKKWTAKKVGYSFKGKYALPEHVAGDVVDLYETQAGINGFAKNVKFIKTAGKPDSLEVVIEAAKDSAAYATIVDTVWNGNQATEKLLKMKTGLNSVYEDFSRAYLYDLDAEGIKADKAILEAYAKKVKGEYDSLLAILQKAPKGNGKKLVDAWAKKVENAEKDIKALADKVKEYTNYAGDPKFDIYNWDDKVLGSQDGPRLYRYYYVKPRQISQATDDANHFILDDVPAGSEWFDVDPATPLSIAPTKADSTLVFNAIVDYFKAVASINEKAVPYLKFIAAVGTGNFKVDSVRADKLEFEGMRMKKTNAYLDGIGIHRAAAYDNKGIMDPGVPPTDASNYVDAFSNLLQLFFHYTEGDPAALSTGLLPSPIYKVNDDDYSATTSGVADYVQYVKDFKADNTAENLDGFQKAFDAYTAADFKKYTQMSDEGKAVANWMDACEKYFGVDGFAGFGEKVFFVYETFTEPTPVAVFQGIPTYTVDPKKGVTGIGRVDVVKPWTYQFEFVAETIEANIEKENDGTAYQAYDYVDFNNDMVMKSKVFELLEADYLVALANGEKSVSEIWEALGEVLAQVKADMDAVFESAAKSQAANNALAAKFNEALNAYRAATKDVKDTRDAAIKAANDAYDAAKKEILDPISAKYVELRNKYNDLMNLADGLRGAYAALWAGGAADVDALMAYLNDKYEKALVAADDIEDEIATLKYLAGMIEIEDPTLDEIMETIQLVEEILAEMDWDEYYDLEFWYEYWKAAYEAAVARFAE